MSLPADRKYAPTHEWYLLEGNTVTLGITQFAADELTDITYVEMPEVGASVVAGKAVGEIESVKATSEIFSAVNGTVSEVNSALSENPEIINEDAFQKGWMLKITVTDSAGLDALMDADTYAKTSRGLIPAKACRQIAEPADGDPAKPFTQRERTQATSLISR